MLAPLLTLALAAQPFVARVDQRLDSPSGGPPRLLVGQLSEPLRGDLRKAALDWALGNRTLLGLPGLATLRVDHAFQSRYGASIHLVQQVAGVDVYGAKAVVTVDRQARVTLVSSSLEGFGGADLDWRLDQARALRLAASAVQFAALQRSGEPYGGGKKVLFAVDGALRAGWLLHVPTLTPADNWYVAVDATRGALLWKQNRSFRAALDAEAYAPSPGGLDGGVGVAPTTAVTLTHPDGGSMVLPVDGGYLEGTQLTAYNCCVNKGCDTTAADAGPKMVAGTFNYNGQNIQYETVICDRMQRASNDPAIHDAGSFVYPPADPPRLVGGQPGPVVQSDPAHTDEFAEVHGFYQVNRIYDWVRGLSSAAAVTFPNTDGGVEPFTMKDERRVPARKPAVWANVMFPDFTAINISCLFQPPCRLTTLGRIDNAAFMPSEEFAQIPLPEYRMDVDTLLMFQGARADFGYDATVLWHEFGHGIVHATAELDFGRVALDETSANNEGGALHEGFADYLAAAFGASPVMGPYVGPRISGGGSSIPGGPAQDTYLRNMENSFSCPEVLWGEVHQDSQHVSAALWDARKNHFQGADQGATFDQAFYASLVAMSPATDFAQTAAIVTAMVKDAFSATVSNAETLMRGLFTQRGVIGCTKVVDVTGATVGRPYFGIADPAGAGLLSGVLPGPYQFKLRTPNGARSATVTARAGGGANPLAGAPQVRLLAKPGAPIVFTRNGQVLSSDAPRAATATSAGNTLTAKVDLDVPCGAGSELYLALGTPSGGGALQDVVVTFEPAVTCTPDAGTDAGTGGGAGGGGGSGGTTYTPSVPDRSAAGPAANVGCGCGAAGGPLALWLLAGLALRRRASRRR